MMLFFWFLAIALFCGAFSVWYATASAGNLAGREKTARIRWVGIVFGIPALVWCIPHAGAVAPDFLAPLFWPLAIVVPITGYFVLDFIFARVAAGWAIIFGYQLVHLSFEGMIPCHTLFAIAGWLLGIGGIWVSGIPRHFRDAVRLAARNWHFRIAMTLFFAIVALLALYGIVWSCLYA
ncbi:MAG: hypothetical protein MJ033_02465 [Victivallaceae bacterium]|nr:hypothetical protein [Victivallaceae bacterium]